MIEAAGLFKHFGNHEVLHDVSLSVDSGAVIAVLGPSGSGSHTLRCLRGFAGHRAPRHTTPRAAPHSPRGRTPPTRAHRPAARTPRRRHTRAPPHRPAPRTPARSLARAPRGARPRAFPRRGRGALSHAVTTSSARAATPRTNDTSKRACHATTATQNFTAQHNTAHRTPSLSTHEHTAAQRPSHRLYDATLATGHSSAHSPSASRPATSLTRHATARKLATHSTHTAHTLTAAPLTPHSLLSATRTSDVPRTQPSHPHTQLSQLLRTPRSTALPHITHRPLQLLRRAPSHSPHHPHGHSAQRFPPCSLTRTSQHALAVG